MTKSYKILKFGKKNAVFLNFMFIYVYRGIVRIYFQFFLEEGPDKYKSYV